MNPQNKQTLRVGGIEVGPVELASVATGSKPICTNRLCSFSGELNSLNFWGQFNAESVG